MRQCAYRIALVVPLILCSANGQEPDNQSNKHSLTWTLADPDKGFVVSAWLFDGAKYRDREEDLLQIQKKNLNRKDVVRIAIPEIRMKAYSILPASGCFLSALLHHWYRQHVKLEFYRGEERLKVILISYRSDGPYGSSKNAVYQLDGEDIGDYEAARKVFSELSVGKDTTAVVLHRDKTGDQWHPRLPQPFPAPLQKWLDAGAHYEVIDDFQWLGHTIEEAYPFGIAFPGEGTTGQAPKGPKEGKDQKKP